MQPGGGERHALVPVGRARIDRANRQVLVEGLASVDAVGLPRYLPGKPAASRRSIEEQILRLFRAGITRPPGEEPAEDHGLFDEDHFYGAQAGAGPAQPGGTPPAEPPGEEEPVEAGLRRDTAGLRHERDVNPRR